MINILRSVKFSDFYWGFGAIALAKKPAEAAANFEKALTADPEYGNAYHFGTLVDYQQGNYEDTWKVVKKASTSIDYKIDRSIV